MLLIVIGIFITTNNHFTIDVNTLVGFYYYYKHCHSYYDYYWCDVIMLVLITNILMMMVTAIVDNLVCYCQ